MRAMRKLLIAVLAAVLALAATALARDRPTTIALPNGFQPEGITAHGSRLFVGSVKNGAVWTSDTKGRSARVLVPGQAGRSAAGLKVRGDRIFVSGAATGKVFIYDRRTGALVKEHTAVAVADPAKSDSFLNDVAFRGSNAYFTESVASRQVLYVVPRNGEGELRTLRITGDLKYRTGFNANGLVTAGRRLITVQTNTGKLFTVNPRSSTAVTREIKLRGRATSLVNGDGLLLTGRTLYVVQNRQNRIAVVRLSRGLTTGRVTAFLTNARLDVPTTVARANGDLWAVNARFSTPATATTRYAVVRVARERGRDR
jgi:sugar lactone lactonase YvrE